MTTNDEEFQFDFSASDEKLAVRIKDGWDEAGKQGIYFGSVYIGRWWVLVLWDGEDDPQLFKQRGVEIAKLQWLPI